MPQGFRAREVVYLRRSYRLRKQIIKEAYSQENIRSHIQIKTSSKCGFALIPHPANINPMSLGQIYVFQPDKQPLLRQ